MKKIAVLLSLVSALTILPSVTANAAVGPMGVNSPYSSAGGFHTTEKRGFVQNGQQKYNYGVYADLQRSGYGIGTRIHGASGTIRLSVYDTTIGTKNANFKITTYSYPSATWSCELQY